MNGGTGGGTNITNWEVGGDTAWTGWLGGGTIVVGGPAMSYDPTLV